MKLFARAAPLAAFALIIPVIAHAQQGVRTSAKQEEPGVVWKDRPTFRLGEGSRIDVHARLQSDYLLRDDSDPDASAFGFDDRLSIARKRVGVDGVLFDRVEFQVEGEIGNTQPWRDVYADVRVNRTLRLRAGRFKLPFSREQLTSGTERDFITRPTVVADLSPSRDVGVMLHGRVARRAVKYEAGVFELDAETRLWKRGAKRTLAGRLTVAPLEDGKWRGSDALEFFGSVLRSDLAEGRGGPEGRLVMGDAFFERLFVNGTRTRLSAGASWDGLHAAVRGEFLHSSDTRLGQAIDGGDLSNLLATGGYVTGLWHLVPGRGRQRGAAPLRALDLAARYDRLSFGSAAAGYAFLNPRADSVASIGKNAWTIGANWYPNRWVKVQANTVREQIVDPLALLSTGTTPFWSTVLRFQVAM